MMKKSIIISLQILLAHSIYSQVTVGKRWDARFGGIDLDQLYAIQQAKDGGYILGGTSYSGISGNKTQPNWDTSLSSPDYWVVKTDAGGNYQWDKRYGGLQDDYLNALCATSDGGCLLGGFSGSGVGGDKTQLPQGGYDYWVVKLDSLGNKQWDRSLGALMMTYSLWSGKPGMGVMYWLAGPSLPSAGTKPNPTGTPPNLPMTTG